MIRFSLLLLLLHSVARAQIKLASEGLCTEGFVALSELNDALTSLTVVAETPRMYLAREGGQGDLRAFDKQTGQPLGFVGMRRFGNGVGHLPVYFTSAKGKGLGTEAKYAAIRYAFEVEGYQEIVASVYRENLPSRGLHKKLGFRQVSAESEGTIEYRLNRADFQAVRPNFGDESLPNFLPRHEIKLRPVTMKVSADPKAMSELHLRFLTELSAGLRDHPTLGALLKESSRARRVGLIFDYSSSLDGQRAALEARGLPADEYRQALDALERPIADALLREHFMDRQFEALIDREDLGPLLKHVQQIVDRGVTGTAREGQRQRMRNFQSALEASGLVRTETRMVPE